MTVTRTINGKSVGDDEMKDYLITNEHTLDVLYRAHRRIAEEYDGQKTRR
jgi:hypothetical protein